MTSIKTIPDYKKPSVLNRNRDKLCFVDSVSKDNSKKYFLDRLPTTNKNGKHIKDLGLTGTESTEDFLKKLSEYFTDDLSKALLSGVSLRRLEQIKIASFCDQYKDLIAKKREEYD